MNGRDRVSTTRPRRAAGLRAAAVAAVTLAAGVAACGGGEEGAAPGAGPSPADVTVSAADTAAAERTVPATVEAASTANISTRMSGTVEDVRVDVGSSVRRGDTLVVLDDRDVEARVDRAAAALRQTRRYHRRIRTLAGDGAATEQELDDAEADLEKARAGLEEARAQRAYVALRSPFDGVVTRRSVDPGDLAAPGRPVLTLVETGSVKVVADLPAELAPTVEAGTPVTVVEPRSGRRAAAEVVRASPAVEASTRQFRVEARFTAGGSGGLTVSPGSFVRLRLAGTGPPAVWVPADAVLRRGQLTGVYVLRADTLRLRWIRAGERRDGSVEALSGLAPGERVVRRPGARLVDGTPAGEVSSRPWSPTLDGRAGDDRPATESSADGPGGGGR